MTTAPLADHPARVRPLMGIACKLLGTLLLAMTGALVKHLSQYYPVNEIVFQRSLFSILPMVIMILMSRERFGLLRTRRPWAHVRRSTFGLLGVSMTFWTVSLLPLADATAMSFSAPLFIVLFAIPLLGERIGVYRIGAVLVGFTGMILIAQPHVTGTADIPPAPFGVVVGVFSAMAVAMGQISSRFAGLTERALTTAFYFTVASTLMASLTLPFGWVTPTLAHWGLFVLLGFVGGLAQFMYTLSFRFAEVSTLAPFDYVTLVWSLVLGLLIFSEFPEPAVLIGAAVVVASGLFIIFRERHLARKQRKARAEPVNT